MPIEPFPLPGFLGRGLASALAVLSLTTPAFAAPSLTLLEQLPQYGQSAPRAINNAGQIVGAQFDLDLPSSTVIWQGSRIATNISASLNPPPGTIRHFSAEDINDSGVVAGAYLSRGISPCLSTLCAQAAVWDGQNVITQPASLSTRFPQPGALGINDAGHSVGFAHVPGPLSTSPYHATLWRDGSATDLGTLGGAVSIARAINNAGVVVGNSSTSGTSGSRATLWQNGGVFDLGTLGGNFGAANDINEKNQIVGSSHTADGLSRATLWDNGAIIDLGAFDGGESFASAINESGLIVGASGSFAALWKDGAIIDLNKYLPAHLKAEGWYLNQATAINNKGWIVGTGFSPLYDQTRAFLLTSAVPEPGSYLMFGVGIALTLLAARRRHPASPRLTPA